MRKILVLLLLLSSLSAGAEGLLNLGVGPIFSVGDTGQPIIEGYNIPNLQWGDMGANIDFQYLYKANENLYLGPEIGVSFLGTKTQKYTINQYIQGQTETDSHSFYFMLASRLYPDFSTSKFYIPFGLGLQRTKISIRPSLGSYQLDRIEASDLAPAGYIGLGVELRREKEDLIAIELRYNMSNLRDDVNGENIKATYRAVSLLLKVGSIY